MQMMSVCDDSMEAPLQTQEVLSQLRLKNRKAEAPQRDGLIVCLQTETFTFMNTLQEKSLCWSSNGIVGIQVQK